MYDRLTAISVNLGVIDFAGGAPLTFDIPLPPGARTLRVLDVLARVTEVFSGATPARVDVGRAGDLDEFASLSIPNASAVGVIVGARNSSRGRVYNSTYVAEAGGTAEMTAVRVTSVDTGTPVTGQAEVTVVFGVDYVEADDGNILA